MAATWGVSCGQGVLFFFPSWDFLPRNTPLWRDPLGEISWERLPGSASLGATPWESLPGTDSLGEIPSERLPGKTLLGPGHPVTQSALHDFLSPSFSACFSNRSRTPLFRSWHRKTFQNGAQTLPKLSPRRVRNRSYVANPEK